MKLFMMPHTVPNRPTNGAVAPMVASTPVPLFMSRPAATSSRCQPRGDALLDAGLVVDDRRTAAARARAASISVGRMPRRAPTRAQASASDRSEPIASIASRNRRERAHSSMFLASHTVQVTTEANTRPIMTAFTRMSADMNIDQGDRSRGSWAAPIAGSGAGPWSKAAGGGAAAGAGPAGANGAGGCSVPSAAAAALQGARLLPAADRRPAGQSPGRERPRAPRAAQAAPAARAGPAPRRGAGEAQSPGSGTFVRHCDTHDLCGLLRPVVGRGRGPFPTRVRRSQGPRVAPDRFPRRARAG